MSDTVGVASPEAINTIFSHLIPALPNVEFGAHLHCTADNWKQKVDAAYRSGCRRFDAAIKGFGGCPMAEDELVGNLATENLISYLNENKVNTELNQAAFTEAMLFSGTVFAS
jgi:hydroxymethylglutaryl-CoA lyase